MKKDNTETTMSEEMESGCVAGACGSLQPGPQTVCSACDVVVDWFSPRFGAGPSRRGEESLTRSIVAASLRLMITYLSRLSAGFGVPSPLTHKPSGPPDELLDPKQGTEGPRCRPRAAAGLHARLSKSNGPSPAIAPPPEVAPELVTFCFLRINWMLPRVE
ncbi:unnamed protein product [Bursaphelenchus okinawaensis]|uniref:Uncharacterized protein n=1 Tax=Bursaphelenchus okinawaensis TaxID=465554 RepID=A0A811L9W9_9BILA|nr:unnamed protein product [Bursaphelenchus okinawaensis]CAG9119910.1 unnamed protein product [Bursaphelenchus okinawaensis]